MTVPHTGSEMTAPMGVPTMWENKNTPSVIVGVFLLLFFIYEYNGYSIAIEVYF